MNKKILFIFPRPISEIPMGIAYLSAVALEEGWQTKAIVNTFNHYYTNKEIVDEVKKFNPSIVGINLGTLELLSAYALIQELRTLNYFIIAGGPHATSCPDEVLSYGVNIVIRNEGEETLRELLKTFEIQSSWAFKNYNSIKGISYRYGGEIYHNENRDYIKNENNELILPIPDFTCFDLDHFRMSNGIIKGMHRIYCSRGCPSQCAFCDNNIFKTVVRYRPVNEVVEEIINKYFKYNIKSFVIADDTFTAKKSFVKEFCEKLKNWNLPIIWSCSTRVNTVNEEILQIMKSAGCYMVSYGVESGDDETLKNINKGITVEQANKAIDMTHKLGLQVYVNLMVGFPNDTIEALKNTLYFMKKNFLKVTIYQVSGSLCPYPKTKIYEDNKQDIDNWWLKEKYQHCGIQIHQNSIEPYKVSTYYQRHMYDDTYIWEEMFFKYSKEYKDLIKEMVFIVGKRNLLSEVNSKFKRFFIYILSKISRFFYEENKYLEKIIITSIMTIIKIKSKFHDRLPLGVKNK